jgi:Protein of unknown function (DUF1565)
MKISRMRPSPPILSVVCLALLTLLFASSANAATYYVATTGNDTNPGTPAQPFRTIGKGITAVAMDGDTILVADGTYTEHDLDFGTKNIVLQSQSNNSVACILDCQNLGLGIRIQGGQTAATVSGLTIRNALSGSNHTGAGIYLRSSTASVTNCIFSGNKFNVPAGLGGDALYVDLASNATVANCTFSANGASANGVVVLANGQTAVSNCTFANNTSSALHQLAGTSTVTSCAFNGNTGTVGGATNGGAINVGGGSMQANGCTFQNNASATLNSNIYATGGNLVLSNCLILSGNFLAANATGASLSMNNSTISGTKAAMVVQNAGNLTVVNSIIWGTDAANSGLFVLSSATATATYSDVRGGFPGIGNINTDPQFINPAGGNCRLLSTSPCLNTGSASAPGLPATDLDGAPRILGSAPDMGAYEIWLPTYGLWFVDMVQGNDTNAGSPTAPFKTVVKAINTASSGSKIYIKAGNYGTDRPRITKSVRLVNWGNSGLARVGKP